LRLYDTRQRQFVAETQLDFDPEQAAPPSDGLNLVAQSSAGLRNLQAAFNLGLLQLFGLAKP
jgi:hypothetical protein